MATVTHNSGNRWQRQMSRDDSLRGVGDAMALLAALGYALFSVLLKKCGQSEENKDGIGDKVDEPDGDSDDDMSLFFGFLGFLALFFAPFVLGLVHILGIEVFEVPSWTVFWKLAGNAFMGNILSNYLWGTAVLMLSPTTTAVGLSLTIPLSIVADQVFLAEHQFSKLFIVGSALVAAGVVFAALDTAMQASDSPDRKDGRGRDRHTAQKLALKPIIGIGEEGEEDGDNENTDENEEEEEEEVEEEKMLLLRRTA